MPQAYLPRQGVPVERTLTGAAAALTAGVDQSLDFATHLFPFADEGDE
jgi:hypothetical protein